MWSFFTRDPSKDFNYEICESVEGRYEENSLWKLNVGKRKSNGERVSIFTYETKKGTEVELDLVKSAIKRLKTLRHPNVTMYLDSLETEKMVYLVTEYVEPLVNRVQNDGKEKELESSWGLHQIGKGLNFLINDCNLSHNNLCIWSILRTEAGEWKLGGMEYVSPTDSPPPNKPNNNARSAQYDPPELTTDRAKTKNPKWSRDMWGLVCLIWEVFNGPLTKAGNLKNPGKIPKSLAAQYADLVGANAANRPNPEEFLRRCRGAGGFFNNGFVNTLLFLEEIQIKDTVEKTRFFNNLAAQLDAFPVEMCKYKILPQLINAYEFGNAGSVVLASMFKLGKLMEKDEYEKKIVPCVVKLFGSTDRATRARLLQQLEHFVAYLQPAIVNDQIFPKILQGFLDTNAAIRENTVKAMLHLAPKLNYNNLNVELMKHFSRLQAKDEQGGIRTNTTVCLGKIAHLLHPQMRQKMLISAFARAMRDEFAPSRTAGILALAATQGYYPLNDIACKVIPALACACVDTDKAVRDQAFKTIRGFLGKLEKVSEDPSLAESMEAEINSIASPTTADLAASWAGWAVMSLTSKFYKSDKSKPTEAPEKSEKTPSTKPIAEPVANVEKMDKPQPVPTSTKHDDDSDNDWNDDWGQLENKDEATSINRKNGDEWDDWGEVDAPLAKSDEAKASAAWGDAEFAPIESDLGQVSSYDWGEKKVTEEKFFDDLMDKGKASKSKSVTSTTTKPTSDWDLSSPWDGGWDSAPVDTSTNKSKREERRIQRQKEINEKREKRHTASGAMKLGEKKKPM